MRAYPRGSHLAGASLLAIDHPPHLRGVAPRRRGGCGEAVLHAEDARSHTARASTSPASRIIATGAPAASGQPTGLAPRQRLISFASICCARESRSRGGGGRERPLNWTKVKCGESCQSDPRVSSPGSHAAATSSRRSTARAAESPRKSTTSTRRAGEGREVASARHT